VRNGQSKKKEAKIEKEMTRKKFLPQRCRSIRGLEYSQPKIQGHYYWTRFKETTGVVGSKLAQPF
jgi:hypothetical protein